MIRQREREVRIENESKITHRGRKVHIGEPKAKGLGVNLGKLGTAT